MSVINKSIGITVSDKDNVVVGVPSDVDYELIKQYMPEPLDKEAIFVYKVKLCDNLVDRDCEQFTEKSLKVIESLYVGKVGIEDHLNKSSNVHSRLYKTEYVEDSTRKNDMGDSYKYVVGYAYTINNDKNKDLIDEIKAGIKKEVSVGLNNESVNCSICGVSVYSRDCNHYIGETYNIDGVNTKCIGLLDSVFDAYEWSFVAVPAQKEAGVIKKMKNKKEEGLMSLKALALKISKIPGIPSEDITLLLKAVDENEKPEGDVVKSLNLEIESLKKSLTAKQAEVDGLVKERDDGLLGEAIEALFAEFVPQNDKMKEMATGLISDKLKIGEDGIVTGIEEAKSILGADEYKPMFKASEAAGDEVVEPVIKPVEATRSANVGKVVSKELDFTRGKSTSEIGIFKTVKGTTYKD